MDLRLLSLLWLILSGCNALADFPESRAAQDAETVADASDMQTADMRQPFTEDAGLDDMNVDLRAFPERFETCPSGAIKLRPRVAIAGLNTNATIAWVDPETGNARLRKVGTFGQEPKFPLVGQQEAPLDSAVSVDIAFHGAPEETENFSHSLTRAFTSEFGVALYPTTMPAEYDETSLAWGTALSGMYHHLLGEPPEPEDRNWFWFESSGEEIMVRSTSVSDGEVQTVTRPFCPAMDDTCVAPDPMQADAFGVAAGTIFMRDQAGYAWMWDPGTTPSRVDLGSGPVFFDQIAVLTENRASQWLFIAELDDMVGAVQVFRAQRTTNQSTTEYEIEPLVDGLVEVGTDIWKIELVGSGGPWHLVATTRTGAVEVFLRDEGKFGSVKEVDVRAPPNPVAWDFSVASVQIGDPAMQATAWIAYAGGDECSLITRAERITLPRRFPPE